MGEIQDGGAKIAASTNVETLKQDQMREINTTPGEASEKFAQDNGMRDRKTAETQVENKEAHLKTGHEKQQMQVDVNHAASRANIAVEEGKRQDKLQQYEADRIGHGRFGKALGAAIDWSTNGKAGPSIGRPEDIAKTENYPEFAPIMKPYTGVTEGDKTNLQSVDMKQSNKK